MNIQEKNDQMGDHFGTKKIKRIGRSFWDGGSTKFQRFLGGKNGEK